MPIISCVTKFCRCPSTQYHSRCTCQEIQAAISESVWSPKVLTWPPVSDVKKNCTWTHPKALNIGSSNYKCSKFWTKRWKVKNDLNSPTRTFDPSPEHHQGLFGISKAVTLSEATGFIITKEATSATVEANLSFSRTTLPSHFFVAITAKVLRYLLSHEFVKLLDIVTQGSKEFQVFALRMLVQENRNTVYVLFGKTGSHGHNCCKACEENPH